MAFVFGILSVLCILYFIVIICYSGLQATFSVVWLMAGIAAAFFCYFLHTGKAAVLWESLPNKLRWLGIGILTAGICLFLVLEGCIISKMRETGEPDLEYVIVLGSQIRGKSPSRVLAKRLDCAVSYLKENPETKAVVSGGQGRDEIVSEASVMAEYLIAHGIGKERVLLEDRSENTTQNIRFSFELIADAEARVGIVSTDFHIFRALGLAKKQGFQNICGIAAKADPVLQFNYMLREACAISKDVLFGNM